MSFDERFTPASASLLLVSGALGSGKSTVLGALRQALPGFAVLEKDRVKEALYDAQAAAPPSLPIDSRQLSRLAVGALWALAPGCPRLILEANFRTGDPAERERWRRLPGRKLEVHCRCRQETAVRRFAERAPRRHPAHSLHVLPPALFREFEQPFGLGPMIELDTEEPLNAEWLRQRLWEHWPDLRPEAHGCGS